MASRLEQAVSCVFVVWLARPVLSVTTSVSAPARRQSAASDVTSVGKGSMPSPRQAACKLGEN